MLPNVLITLTFVALARAQSSTVTPLVSKKFSYPTGIPEKVDTDVNQLRGSQSGYNICNSTTEGPTSLCQTSFLNSLDDFCLWAPSKPDSTIGNNEGSVVAWCTKPGRGTRVIPAGAVQGVQFMRTSDYVQVAGFVDQSKIDMQASDFGGQLDPHGADNRGNPLGGIVFSNAWSGSNTTYTQAIEWYNAIGLGAFCFKVCDPSKAHPADYCQHNSGLLGCTYNAPSNVKKGIFEYCDGDVQDFPGVYTDASGATQTLTLPAGNAALTSVPYSPRIPASSNCVQYQSAALFATTTTGSSASSTNSPSGPTSGASPGAQPGSQTSGASSRPPVGAIVGGVLGGVALLVLLALGFVLWRRRKNRVAPSSDPQVDEPNALSYTVNSESDPSPPSNSLFTSVIEKQREAFSALSSNPASGSSSDPSSNPPPSNSLSTSAVEKQPNALASPPTSVEERLRILEEQHANSLSPQPLASQADGVSVEERLRNLEAMMQGRSAPSEDGSFPPAYH